MKSLIGFYNEMTGLVHEGGEVNVIYLHLGKAFDTVFHNTLTGKLMKHGLEKWTARWIEKLSVISSAKRSWKVVPSNVPRGLNPF